MWFPNNLKFIRTLVDEQRNQPKLQKHLSAFTQALQEWEEQIEARASQKSSREEDVKRVLNLLPRLETQLQELYKATASLGTTTPLHARNIAKLCASFADIGDECKPFLGLLKYIPDIFNPESKFEGSSKYKQVTVPFTTNLTDRWLHKISHFWYPKACDFSLELFKQVRRTPSLTEHKKALAKHGIPYLGEESMFSYQDIKPTTSTPYPDYIQRILDLQQLVEHPNTEQWLPITGVQVDICKEAKGLLNLLEPILAEVNTLNARLQESLKSVNRYGLKAVEAQFTAEDLEANFPIFYELVLTSPYSDPDWIEPQDILDHLFTFNLGFYGGEVIYYEKEDAYAGLDDAVVAFKTVFQRTVTKQSATERRKELKPILGYGMHLGLAISQVKNIISKKYRIVQQQLEQLRNNLEPWRKGPFTLFGQEFDSEWVADLKMRRLSHIYTLESRLDKSKSKLIKEDKKEHDLRLAELSWVRQLQFNANELKKDPKANFGSMLKDPSEQADGGHDWVRYLVYPLQFELPNQLFRPLDYIGNSVLDVGAGNGAFLWKFAEHRHTFDVSQIFVGIDSFEKFALQHAVVDLCMKYTDLNVLPLRMPYNMEAVPADYYNYSNLLTIGGDYVGGRVTPYTSAITEPQKQLRVDNVWVALRYHYTGFTWKYNSVDIRAYFYPQFEGAYDFLTPDTPRKKLLPWHNVHLLPLPLDKFPETGAFDTVICMGVLYHRRDPVTFLEQLRKQLDKGHLILETLYNPDPKGQDYYPADGKYAGMSNVYCLPTLATLNQWLNQAGFKSWKVAVGSEPTSNAEQRSTAISSPTSIQEFLAEKPEEIRPTRIIIVAEKK